MTRAPSVADRGALRVRVLTTTTLRAKLVACCASSVTWHSARLRIMSIPFGQLSSISMASVYTVRYRAKLSVCAAKGCDSRASSLSEGALCRIHADRARSSETPNHASLTATCVECDIQFVRSPKGMCPKYCIDCRARRRLLSERSRSHDRSVKRRESFYGLTAVDFDKMILEQDNACKLCGCTFTSKATINVDHDHAHCPGKMTCGECVRGLLCITCNTRLGAIENADWMQAAVDYLNAYTNLPSVDIS